MKQKWMGPLPCTDVADAIVGDEVSMWATFVDVTSMLSFMSTSLLLFIDAAADIKSFSSRTLATLSVSTTPFGSDDMTPAVMNAKRKGAMN